MLKKAAFHIPLLILNFACSIRAMEVSFQKRFEAALDALAIQTISVADFSERVATLMRDNLRDRIRDRSSFVDWGYFNSHMEQLLARVKEIYEQRLATGDQDNARAYLLQAIRAVYGMKQRFVELASDLREAAHHEPEWDGCMCAVCDAIQEASYTHMDTIGRVYAKLALLLLAERPTGALGMPGYRFRMKRFEKGIGSGPYAEAHIKKLLQIYMAEKELSGRLAETEAELRTTGRQFIEQFRDALRAKAATFTPPLSDTEFEEHYAPMKALLEKGDMNSTGFISQARDAATHSTIIPIETNMHFEAPAALFAETEAWLRTWDHCVKNHDCGASALLEGQGRQLVTALSHTQGDEGTITTAQKLLIKISERLLMGIPNGILGGLAGRFALLEADERTADTHRAFPEILAAKARYVVTVLAIADRITDLERQRRQHQELRRIKLDMLE